MAQRPESHPPETESQDAEAIRQEIEATKRRIQADLDALSNQFSEAVSLRPLRQQAEAHPWLLAAAGAGLLAAVGALFMRSREEAPPLPPRGSRRLALAKTVRTAEDEGLVGADTRKLVIALLTAEGMRWLQHYLAQRASTAQRRLAEQSAPLRAQLHEVAEEVGDQTQQTATRAQRRLDEFATQAEDMLHNMAR